MKRLVLVFAAIIITFGCTSEVSAQATIVGTTSGAVIVTPVSLTEVAPLNFGVLAVLPTTPGTCLLGKDGKRFATGGVNLSAQAPAATNAAYFVTGQVNTSYTLTLPTTIIVTDVVSGTSMSVGSLRAHFLGDADAAVISTLDESGDDSFTIGGTLEVPAGQNAGSYVGSFNVTVAYN